MAARGYNLDLPYNSPDMLYNGYYTWEVYSNLYGSTGSMYVNKYDEQEFYGEEVPNEDVPDSPPVGGA
jgi:hypothetical protein